MTVINIIAKNKIIRLFFTYIFIIFVSILYSINPSYPGTGDEYKCEKIQAIKITEKLEKIKFESFKLSWLEETIHILEGPIVNNYEYKITYKNKNSFTAANRTLAAIIRFSETQKAAYLSFTFSTPFSVTTLLAKCQKLT